MQVTAHYNAHLSMLSKAMLSTVNAYFDLFLVSSRTKTSIIRSIIPLLPCSSLLHALLFSLNPFFAGYTTLAAPPVRARALSNVPSSQACTWHSDTSR